MKKSRLNPGCAFCEYLTPKASKADRLHEPSKEPQEEEAERCVARRSCGRPRAYGKAVYEQHAVQQREDYTKGLFEETAKLVVDHIRRVVVCGDCAAMDEYLLLKRSIPN